MTRRQRLGSGDPFQLPRASVKPPDTIKSIANCFAELPGCPKRLGGYMGTCMEGGGRLGWGEEELVGSCPISLTDLALCCWVRFLGEFPSFENHWKSVLTFSNCFTSYLVSISHWDGFCPISDHLGQDFNNLIHFILPFPLNRSYYWRWMWREASLSLFNAHMVSYLKKSMLFSDTYSKCNQSKQRMLVILRNLLIPKVTNSQEKN